MFCGARMILTATEVNCIIKNNNVTELDTVDHASNPHIREAEAEGL